MDISWCLLARTLLITAEVHFRLREVRAEKVKYELLFLMRMFSMIDNIVS